jgi:hypothetical protein
MPSKQALRDWLDHEIKQGRGDDPVHLVDIKREQRERIANPKGRTRWQLETDDPVTYSRLHSERERIFKACAGQKSMAIEVICLALEAMTNQFIQKLRAQEEGPSSFET